MIPTSSWDGMGGNDDQVLAIMQHVIDVFHVDEDRVHMAGYSQGGAMTWRFLCKHSDMLASVAPIAAGAPSAAFKGCAFSATDKPAHERSVFYTHGTTDGLVAFSTAEPQRDAVISTWNMKEKEVLAEGDDHKWTRWENDNGTVFEFMQHDWATTINLGAQPLEGHCFPGGSGILGCGKMNGVIVWGEDVMKFFMAHPRPKD
jgi:poly(3-hydroxybutyrate) depolymerase